MKIKYNDTILIFTPFNSAVNVYHCGDSYLYCKPLHELYATISINGWELIPKKDYEIIEE